MFRPVVAIIMSLSFDILKSTLEDILNIQEHQTEVSTKHSHNSPIIINTYI